MHSFQVRDIFKLKSLEMSFLFNLKKSSKLVFLHVTKIYPNLTTDDILETVYSIFTVKNLQLFEISSNIYQHLKNRN